MLAQYLWNVWDLAVVTAACVFVFTVVIFIHELGHFLVARYFGVTVAAFSIGIGKELYSFVDRYGTRWRIAAAPIGGYVKFADDENGASMPSKETLERMTPQQRAGSFHHKPLYQKAAVVVAGPLANFLLSIVLLSGIFMTVGVPMMQPRVDSVRPDSAAERAGMKSGDLVLAIDGSKIESFSDMQRIVGTSAGRELNFEIDRGGAIVRLKATPLISEVPDGLGGKMRVGLLGVTRTASPVDVKYRSFGPIESVKRSISEIYFSIAQNLGYAGRVVSLEEKPDQLRGPIGIIALIKQIVAAGFVPLLHITAMISVSIGLLNLFPIPLLDGGHLMFYAIEAIRRKPLSERTQELGFRVGIAVVLMLMVFATWNDLGIVKRWLGGNG